MVSMTTTACCVSPALALFPLRAVTIVWGIAHCGFYSAQQARLIGLAGVAAAPVALSLNASFTYLGFSLGAFVGLVTLRYAYAAQLGWAAGAFDVASLLLMLAINCRQRPVRAQSAVAACAS